MKTVSSFAEKVRRKKYKYRFLGEVTDIVGIRVITYLAGDVDKAYLILCENFLVDAKNSVDKRVAATISQFGYQSLHVIAQLNKDRAALPEYSRFQALKFEIQVRSILQHSWAEIEHDINYKSVIELTPSIKRKLHRASALLEQADEIFDEIGCDLIEKNNIDSKIGKHGADTRITPKLFALLLEKDEFVIQLQEILDSLSRMRVSREMDPPSILSMRIVDLNMVGIYTVRDLRAAVAENIHYLPDFFVSVVMRRAMMIQLSTVVRAFVISASSLLEKLATMKKFSSTWLRIASTLTHTMKSWPAKLLRLPEKF